jgi:hypothetical protein
MKTSEQINELAAALCKAQAMMKPAKKSEQNPYFKSKYADLTNVVENDRKALTDNGLAIVQGGGGVASPTTGEINAVCVTTRIVHTSGQWIEDVAGASPKDFTPQSVGAAITYLRRYEYQAMVGATAEGDDDDAESVTDHTPGGKSENNTPEGKWEVAGDLPKGYWTKRDKASLFQAFGPAVDYKAEKVDGVWKALRIPMPPATAAQAEKLAEIF